MLEVFAFLKQLNAAFGADVDIRLGYIPDDEFQNTIMLRFDWRRESYHAQIHIRESDAGKFSIESIQDKVGQMYKTDHANRLYKK